MKLEILCGSGSPDGVVASDIYGRNGRVGVGGAELGLLTLAEGWKNAGHEVILYNNPRLNDGIIEQRAVADFVRAERGDVVIFFREPTARAEGVKALKIFWSCDQHTSGNFAEFSKLVDRVVTISDYHSAFFRQTYGIEESISIDLPVRTWEYEKKIQKVPKRMIFTSVPDRGLSIVAETFPGIRERVPDASIVITSDYRLWGVQSPMNQQYIQQFMGMDGVIYLGGVPRERLIEEQLKAEVHYYPCVYEELFCIAVAESQVAGALPITTEMGALRTTNMFNVIPMDANQSFTKDTFVQEAVAYLTGDTGDMRSDLREMAIRRFSLDNILRQWDEKVFS